jgi:hypothetical protein
VVIIRSGRKIPSNKNISEVNNVLRGRL